MQLMKLKAKYSILFIDKCKQFKQNMDKNNKLGKRVKFVSQFNKRQKNIRKYIQTAFHKGKATTAGN